MGEYCWWDKKTNIDLLVTNKDSFVPVIRLSLLERDDPPLSHTKDKV